MVTANDNGFTDKAYFCPACGSSMVDIQSITDSTNCKVCGWAGNTQDLAAMPFSQEMGSPEQVLKNLTLDIRGFMSKGFSLEFIQLLRKWGFVSEPLDPKEIARYMGSIAKGLALGLIETRQEIEKENIQA